MERDQSHQREIFDNIPIQNHTTPIQSSDSFGFLKADEKQSRSTSFFSKNGLSRDIIQVTGAEPDVCLEIFYALYHTLLPQIERQSDLTFMDAWRLFIGGVTFKGSLCPPENLIEKKVKIMKLRFRSGEEELVFQNLDRLANSILHLKQKVIDYPGQILQREEIIASLDLGEAFYKDYREKVKTLIQTIIKKEQMNVLSQSEYDELEDLLEPKAVMMSDSFSCHWAFRISRTLAQKILCFVYDDRMLRNSYSVPSYYRVTALPENVPEPLVYFKANGSPSIQPEKEFMLSSLYRHLQIPVSETALLILTNVSETNPGDFYAVQASEAVIGESSLEACQNQEIIFEEKAFVEQVIGALLTNPSGGNFSNYKYSPRDKTLISINNHLIFEPELIGKDIVNVKSILYFLPQMDLPIPESIKQFFTTLDPDLTVFAWLKDLSQKNKEYNLLFSRLAFQKTRFIYQNLLPQDEAPPLTVCLEQKIFVDYDLQNGSFCPQILVSKELLSGITDKLQLIEKTLLNNRSASSQILFEEMSPVLGKFYRKLKLEFSDPEEALKAVWGYEKNGVDYSKILSLLDHEEFDNLVDNNIMEDQNLLPEMFFNEYKSKLISGKNLPLDNFIQYQSQRKIRNLLDLSQTLKGLQLLIQEGLTDSRSPRDIVDFCYSIVKMTETDHHLRTEITSLLSNLENPELKWLFTLEEYFMRPDYDALEDLKVSSSSIPITGAFLEERIFYLTESEKEKIFDDRGHIKRNTSLTGHSNVTYFPRANPKFYLKEYPEWPGYEFASLLFMRMIGITQLPYQDLTIFNSASPVLLTQAVDGDLVYQVWQNPQAFGNLDAFHTGLLIVAAILLNPEDGKEDNFLLSRDGKYLIPIDNDHCFLPSTFQKGKFWNIIVNTALQTKTLLFCLDEMNKPIPNEVKQHILGINFDLLLQSWLQELVKVEDRYNNLVGQEQRNAFLQKGTVLRISFYEQFIHSLYWKVNKIQDLLISSTEQTPFSLLKAVEPFTARCYQDSFQHGQTLESRFKAATNELYVEEKKKVE